MATFVGYDTPVRCGTGSYTIFMDATPSRRAHPPEQDLVASRDRFECRHCGLLEVDSPTTHLRIALNGIGADCGRSVSKSATFSVGGRPYWVTFTPDSKRAYIATENTNSVSVIDVPTRKEVTRVKVGPSPKRNITALLP